MASWMSAFALIVLWANCIPAEEVDNRLCGKQLVEAVKFVCGDKGVYDPNNTGIFENPLDLFSHYVLEKRQQNYQQLKQRRGIVEECCLTECPLSTLEKYCNP